MNSNRLDTMTQQPANAGPVVNLDKPTGGREVSPETFAKLADMDLKLVWSWINGRSTVRFDERDLVRYSSRTVRIIYQAPNAAGKGHRPRTTSSVHESGGTGAVKVDPIEDAGVLRVTHPDPENIERDPAFSVVSGVSVPEGFKVFRRARRAPHASKQAGSEGSWRGVNAAE